MCYVLNIEVGNRKEEKEEKSSFFHPEATTVTLGRFPVFPTFVFYESSNVSHTQRCVPFFLLNLGVSDIFLSFYLFTISFF